MYLFNIFIVCLLYLEYYSEAKNIAMNKTKTKKYLYGAYY